MATDVPNKALLLLVPACNLVFSLLEEPQVLLPLLLKTYTVPLLKLFESSL